MGVVVIRVKWWCCWGIWWIFFFYRGVKIGMYCVCGGGGGVGFRDLGKIIKVGREIG